MIKGADMEFKNPNFQLNDLKYFIAWNKKMIRRYNIIIKDDLDFINKVRQKAPVSFIHHLESVHDCHKDALKDYEDGLAHLKKAWGNRKKIENFSVLKGGL